VTARLLRHVKPIRAAGLLLLVAGLAVVLAWSVPAGLVVIAVAAIPLGLSHPLLVQRARSRAGRRAAAQNGRPGPVLPEDVDAT
jgi:hypothetical protein